MGNRLKVFISYRRKDSKEFAEHIHTHLENDYDVFLDTEDGIPYGEKFLNVIKNSIEEADVVLMVIGKDACTEFESRKGKEDYVVKEIEHAHASSCKIIPVLMNGANIPNCFPDSIAFVSELNIFQFGNKFSMYIRELKEKLQKEKQKTTQKIKKELNSTFLQQVVEGIEKERLVVLFSQDFTDIHEHYQQIRAEMKARFSDDFYTVSVPSYVNDEEEYFGCIANDCGMVCKVKKVHDWSVAMKNKLEESQKPLMLFVTEIENGDEKLDKKFTRILRDLSLKYSHFHVLCIGRKDLAKLVYGEGHLSPLNNAKELFFPDVAMKLGEEKIAQQFQTMGKYRGRICKLLQKEKVGRYSTWSYDETINQLFWKNLLVKNGNKFTWRGELTKEVASEVLGCDGDVV